MNRNTLILAAAMTVALMTGTANAGEPFHPFWEPTYDALIDPFVQIYYLMFP